MPLVLPDYSAMEPSNPIGFTPEGTESRLGSADAANRVTHEKASLIGSLAAGVFGGVVDTVDSMASSLTLGHIERGRFNNAVLNTLDSPGLTDWFYDNYGAVELGSGIATILATELAATKVGGAMRASETVGKLPVVGAWMKRLDQLEMYRKASLATVRQVDRDLAAQGAVHMEQFLNTTATEVTKLRPIRGLLETETRTLSRAQALNRAQGASALSGIVSGLGAEARITAAGNQNGFLFDDELSTNLMYAGLGLAASTALPVVTANYGIRKFVHTDEYTDLAREALDAGDIDRLRDEAQQATGGVSLLTSGQELLTDRLTIEALQGQGRMTQAASTQQPTRFANLRASATQNTQQAFDLANRVTLTGMQGVPGSGFRLDGTAAGQAVKVAIHEDPTALHGVTEMSKGGVVDHLTGQPLSFQEISERKLASIDNRIEEIQKELDPTRRKRKRGEKRKPLTESESRALQVELSDLRRQKTFDHQVYRNGEFVPVEDLGDVPFGIDDLITARAMGGDDFIFGTDTLRGVQLAQGARLHMDTTGTIYFPKGKGLNQLSHSEAMNLFRLGDKVAANILNNPSRVFQVPKNPSWFHLDLAEEIIDRAGGNSAKVVFPDGMTRETAQLESLAQKAAAIQKIENRKGLTPYLLAERFNLPRLSSYERGLLGESATPIDVILRNARDPDVIRNSTTYELRKAWAEMRTAQDFRDFMPSELESLRGNSFRIGRDSEGNPLDPFMVIRRPFDRDVWTRDNLAMRMATEQMQSVSIMAGDPSAPITARVISDMLMDPDTALAAQTSKIQDIQRAGTAPGIGANRLATGVASSFDFRYRGNPTMLAAQRVPSKVERLVLAGYERLALAHKDIFAKLRAPKNLASRVQLEEFISHRMGWDLADQPIRNGDGWSFVLKQDSPRNHERWRLMFGGERMPRGAVLSAPVQTRVADTSAIHYSLEKVPAKRDIILDDLALDGAKGIDSLMQTLRNEKNVLHRARGGREIDRVNWYVPPKDFQDQHVGLIYTKDGRLYGMISADTPQQYTREANQILARSAEGRLPDGMYVVQQKDVEDFLTLWERSQLDLLDPNLTAVQPGKRNTGRGQNPLVERQSLDRVLDTIQSNYMRHGRDIVETYYRHSINAAKARDGVASRAVSRNKAALGQPVEERTIHRDYVNALLRRSPVNDKTWMSRIHQLLDTVPNYALRGIFDFWYRSPGMSWRYNRRLQREYDQLVTKLGERMPFDSVNEYIERSFSAKTPPEIKKLVNKANHLTASLILRYDFVQPLMNMAGVINNLPAVIRQMAPRAGENADEYMLRNGHLVTAQGFKDGQAVGFFDTSKLIARVISKWWKGDYANQLKYMAETGFGRQEIAEFNRQMASLKDRPGWHRVFAGDPTAESVFARKGIDGILGFLSDSSEDWSRSWSHLTGYELAEWMGYTSETAKHAFAHDFANKTIANYNPMNRPEVFQGGVGSLLGLFQSFIWNYYQRLYRYIETADINAAARQYAMQATLFGAQTTPGFDEWNTVMGWASGGEDSPYDSIYDRFDRRTADVLSAGTLSNLPTLFGQPGMALYTRGDTKMQVPGAVQFPAANVAARLSQLFTDSLEMFRSGHPDLSVQEVAEIFARASPNRPLSGLIESIATDGTTDRSGQLVAEINSGMEAVYRMLGTRSLSDQKEIEAFYQNKRAQESQLAQMSRLKKATRALIRSGNPDAAVSAFERYAEIHHGDVSNFRRWYRDTYLSATQTRSERQLLDAMGNIDRMQEVNRLINAGTLTGMGSFDPDATE